jgi:hypothetical protein
MDPRVSRAIERWAAEHRGGRRGEPDVVFHERLETKTWWRENTVKTAANGKFRLTVRAGGTKKSGIAYERNERSYGPTNLLVASLDHLAEPSDHVHSAVFLLLEHLLEHAAEWTPSPDELCIETTRLRMNDGTTYTTRWVPGLGLFEAIAGARVDPLVALLRARTHGLRGNDV